MILEKQTEATILETGDSSESIGMSLDLDSAQILMQMLSKNLYSDSIGSTIRECASNALDSHRRAGVDKPIVVGFKKNKEDNYEFTVEDFGIGLDADDVRNIISKYGKSTKRNSNTELGMMGLGFKAPLAYSSSFYFVCRKNGMERKYMMYEGEDTNSIDLLYETSTTEENGVKIIIPVNYYDRGAFTKKIKEQLAYFESVYFDCEDSVNNDFIIHRSEHFQFSELSSSDYLHISLDNVYYPIDFDKLGIKERIDFPVALRFSLTDGLFPTPNRESIRYTKEAKQIILDKIKKVADFYANKYNENIIESDDIMAVIKHFSESQRYVKGFKTDSSLNISNLHEWCSVKLLSPTLKGVKLLDLERVNFIREHLLQEYEIKHSVSNNRMKEAKRSYDQVISILDINRHKLYIYSDKISGAKKNYLKSIHTGRWDNEGKLVKRKHTSVTLGSTLRTTNYKTYVTLLELKKHPKSEWRDRIKEYQHIVSLLTNNFINLDEMVIPDIWIKNNTRAKAVITGTTGGGVRRVKLAGEIVGKEGTPLERYVDGKNCKWVSTTYKLEEIHRMKHLVIYGGDADVAKMDKLFSIVAFNRMKTKIKFIQFSERELKNLEKIDIHNWVKLETFMEGKNKPFKRLVTAYLIHQLMKKNEDVFEKKQQLKDISDDLYLKLDLLEEYKGKHFCYANEDIYSAMLEIANANNLFDGEIYPMYKEIKTLTEKLTFLQPLCDKLSYYRNEKDPILDAITDLFKYYRTRIDWKNYNIKLTEEKLLEKELTEENVEELID
jgi:Histidine kinase-, DNA gyrase B-, and HSP90-like ATPase